MLTQEQEKKVEVAYERYRWAAKEAERLFDMPLAGRRARELAFARYPKLYKAWRDAISYVIERRKEMGNPMILMGRPVESVEDVLGVWDGVELSGGWMNA